MLGPFLKLYAALALKHHPRCFTPEVDDYFSLPAPFAREHNNHDKRINDMNTIANVLSRIDHSSSLEDRINQIASSLVSEYRSGNRLLEDDTFYIFTVCGVPSYGAMANKPDFDARINDMRDYCLWCAAHGVTETIYIGEVWKTATSLRPSEAPDRSEALVVAGIGQKEGGIVAITLPIPDADIKPVEMQPRGTLGTFDLLAPSIEVTGEGRSEALGLLTKYDVRVFGNFLTSSDVEKGFKINPLRQYFGFLYPIHSEMVQPNNKLLS